MGDRCYVRIWIRDSDRARVEEILDCPLEDWFQEIEEDPTEPGILELGASEVDGGMTQEREAIAIAGIPYHGYSTEGESYGSYDFIGFERNYYECPNHTSYGRVVPLVEDDGNGPPVADIGPVVELWEAERMVYSLFSAHTDEERKKRSFEIKIRLRDGSILHDVSNGQTISGEQIAEVFKKAQEFYGDSHSDNPVIMEMGYGPVEPV